MKLPGFARTTDTELLDDFSLSGDELADSLAKIALINRLLGGNRITLSGVDRLVKIRPEQTSGRSAPLRIVDLGCGNGDLLRALATRARRKSIAIELTGIDGNPFAIETAKKLSYAFSNIRYHCADLLGSSTEQYDIALCTLTLHHFSDEQIVGLLKDYYGRCSLGVVINDLKRSKTAFALFYLLSFILNLNELSTKDGFTSIRRGFKREELARYTSLINPARFQLSSQAGFRLRLILYKATHG